MENKSRYFIYFYKGFYENNTFEGVLDVESVHGAYINKITIDAQLKNEYGYSEILPTNIIEINEQDFKDWSADPKI